MSKEKRLRMARKIKRRISLELQQLRSGELNLRDVLESPHGALKRVAIHTILCNAPKMGPDGAKKVLKEAKVWPMDQLGKLTEDERDRVLSHLPPRVANRYPKVREED